MPGQPSSTTNAGAAGPALPYKFPIAEVLISLGYMAFGAVWVTVTDHLATRFMGDPPESASMQTLKGLNFVFTSGVLLYLVLRRSFQRRRHAEASARLGQERFELAARAATDAIWDLNVVNGHLWWSDGIEKLFGYPRGDVQPTLAFWTDRLHPDDRERVDAGFHRAIDGAANFWADDYRFRCHDGHYAFVQDRGFIIRDAHGKALRMVGGMTDITQRKESEQRLESSRRQLRALSARLEQLREEERTRIAREIHDELGQLLTALKMDLRWMEKRLGATEGSATLNPVLDKLIETEELADKTIETVQKISTELRPGLLDSLGLTPALCHEAVRFQERTGVSCRVSVPDPPPDLSQEAATAVFRIWQEALTNVARHAEASAVRGDFFVAGDDVVLRIEDNGRGIPSGAIDDPKSLGLLGMRERAGVLGGDLRIEPATPRGTRVVLRLPKAADPSLFWTQI